MSNTVQKKSLMTRFLNIVEKTGNKLPDPIILFLVCVLFFSYRDGDCFSI